MAFVDKGTVHKVVDGQGAVRARVTLRGRRGLKSLAEAAERGGLWDRGGLPAR